MTDHLLARFIAEVEAAEAAAQDLRAAIEVKSKAHKQWDLAQDRAQHAKRDYEQAVREDKITRLNAAQDGWHYDRAAHPLGVCRWRVYEPDPSAVRSRRRVEQVALLSWSRQTRPPAERGRLDDPRVCSLALGAFHTMGGEATAPDSTPSDPETRP